MLYYMQNQGRIPPAYTLTYSSLRYSYIPFTRRFPAHPHRLHALVDSRNAIAQVPPPLCPTITLQLARNHKPSLPNQIPKLRLAWEPFNTLHQILITIPISSHNLPDQRYRSETPPLVHEIKRRILHLRELETREHAA